MNRIAVIGAGTMGAGIAQVAARHGCTVYLNDVDAEAIQRGIDAIAERADRCVTKGTLEPAKREAMLELIKPIEALDQLGDVELVIEAIDEDLDAKQNLFAKLEEAVPETAILATNTSSLSVTQIAESLERPLRLVGMHFFNPAPVMELVEVVAADTTDDATVDAACDVAKKWGKTPVRVKDSPGFVVNRVARGYYLEALGLLGEGVAGVDEIDATMRIVGGFKMGPFALMDLIGLDVSLAAGQSIWVRKGKPARLEPHAIQRKLVEEGHLGRKTGRGFYLYQDNIALPAYPVDRRSFQVSPLLSDAMLAFTERGGCDKASATEQYVFCRILGAIINEAGFAFEDGVAGCADIDIAMMKGANYPKGPFAWSDDIGHRTHRGVLKAFNRVFPGGRYKCASAFW